MTEPGPAHRRREEHALGPPLWPAPAAAWLVASLYAGRGFPTGALATAAAGLACGSLACWYGARRLGRLALPGGRPPGRRWAILLALALACAGAASVAGGAAADGATRGAVVEQWGGGRLVEASVELRETPRELRNGSLLVAGTLLGVRERRGGELHPAGGVTVTVIGTRDRFGPQRLDPGTRLSWWVSAAAPPERGPAALVLTPRSVPLAATPSPDDLAARLRGGLATWFSHLRGGPLEDGAALVPGMVVGDRSAQSPALATAMQRAGLSHLTAVSGSKDWPS